jgi:HK97 gp10 family phage protein
MGNGFDDIANKLDAALSQIVRKTALDGQANIQRHIQSNDQVDTGKMLNSVYVKTADESTYKGGEDILPEVEAPPDNKTAYIGVGASYAIFQNYGTRFMPGRPFFEPGIEETRQGFEAAIARVESILGGQ